MNTTKFRLFYALVVPIAFLMTFGTLTAVSAPSMTEFEQTIVNVADDISPSVVSVEVEKNLQQDQPQGFQFPFGQEFFERFFGEPQPRNNQFRRRGGGSGFIVSKQGHIVTNHHVVKEADEVTVTLADDREFQAEVIGGDPRTDVGVIKIDASNLEPLKFGNSEDLKVGQWVLAMGNPVGFSQTLTTGVVSAKGRSTVGITDVEDFIQTDAAINPGNSGGPLIDLNGKVVGINTAIVSHTGGYMGIGFAIPIDMAEKVYNQILKHGNVKHGYLGIVIRSLTKDLAQAFGINTTDGILISEVADNSPASKAGLKNGDVIVRFDGERVEEIGAFRNKVAFLKPGSTYDITVIRDRQRKTLSVVIGKYPETKTAISAKEQKDQTFRQLAFTVQNLTPELAERLGYEVEKGVVVSQVKPRSDAFEAGIRPGLMIKEVNQQPVKNVNQFHNAIQQAPKGKPILLYVFDGEYSNYITLRLEQ